MDDFLTSEDKAQIRAQEIFRDEVKRDLKAKRSDEKSFLSILNQPIMIWLLSTVVVGLITLGYNKLSENSRKQSAVYERVLEIDVELSSRIRSIEMLLSPELAAELGEDSFVPMFTSMISDFGFISQLGQQSARTGPQKRTLISLMWELDGLVPARERDDIVKAIAITEKLNELFSIQSISGFDFDFEMDSENPGEIEDLKLLLNQLGEIKRWTNLTSRNIDIKAEMEKIEEVLVTLRLERLKKLEIFENEQQVREDEVDAHREILKEYETDEIREQLAHFTPKEHSWSVAPSDDPERCDTHMLSVILFNRSELSIDYIEGRLNVYKPDGTFIVVEDVIDHARFAPQADFSLSTQMELGLRTQDLSNFSPEELNNMIVIFTPNKILYQGRFMEEYDRSGPEVVLKVAKDMVEPKNESNYYGRSRFMGACFKPTSE